jgi:RNA polymerase sigma-70 factor, ECF subfamily
MKTQLPADEIEGQRLAAFLAEEKRLLRLAYRHLGSVAEAEDVVQEAWLRFAAVAEVRDARHLLSTIVTRLCLDRIKSARARRETYVGPWLPEPATGDAFVEAGDSALDISFAVMRVLERLSPAERAAYFLHDLWGFSFEEVADALHRSPAACRKLASRARAALASEAPRFQPDAKQVDRLAEAFRASVESGDPAMLKALLAEEAELIADGGGKVLAALNIITGADAVSRFLTGVTAKAASVSTIEMRAAVINGAPGLVALIDGGLDQTFTFDLDAEGRVRTIYIVRNPDKLERLRPLHEGS